MKIYDTHSDILSNLYQRTLAKEKDVFARYHLQDLTQGHIAGGIWVVYSDTDFDIQKAYDIALTSFKPYQNIFDVVYGLEGLRNVLTLDALDALYQKGIRHASLTWNEENHLATGVAGDEHRGLTTRGKQFLDYMVSHQMIIDVSHLNQKSFYDVIEYTDQNIIASHSNAYTLSNHRRNLKDEQLAMLREIGGYVGVVGARNFVSKDQQKQNIAGLIDQMVYIGDKIGIDHVMIGLDMMNFLDDFQNSNLDDLQSHRDAPQIITKMKMRGFTEAEISGIAYRNFLQLRKTITR